MNGQAALVSERALRRIVALLVALAVLSERAAARSAPIRWLVLLLLRRAETAAEEFVFEATGLPPAPEGIAAAGNGPADALRLAARFRALAAALSVQLPNPCRLVYRSARHRFAAAPVVSAYTRRPAGGESRTMRLASRGPPRRSIVAADPVAGQAPISLGDGEPFSRSSGAAPSPLPARP